MGQILGVLGKGLEGVFWFGAGHTVALAHFGQGCFDAFRRKAPGREQTHYFRSALACKGEQKVLGGDVLILHALRRVGRVGHDLSHGPAHAQLTPAGARLLGEFLGYSCGEGLGLGSQLGEYACHDTFRFR